MIEQSPQSEMREPYRTYVDQRAQSVAKVLKGIVGDTDVQLCPRAITEDEVTIGQDGLIYGCVVNKNEDGYKSVLYDRTRSGFYSSGDIVRTPQEAGALAIHESNLGNRLRLKNPYECDAQGQYVVSTHDEACDVFITADCDHMVAMPNLAEINGRYSIGRIDLGNYGTYGYIGREVTTRNNGEVVYGGCDIAVAPYPLLTTGSEVSKVMGIPEVAIVLGLDAINRYHGIAKRIGRVSFDVLSGLTDNGTSLLDVVDVTPRVGGTTPAEILAIEELTNTSFLHSYARTRLFYDGYTRPVSGTNFIDTDSLIVNAKLVDLNEF